MSALGFPKIILENFCHLKLERNWSVERIPTRLLVWFCNPASGKLFITNQPMLDFLVRQLEFWLHNPCTRDPYTGALSNIGGGTPGSSFAALQCRFQRCKLDWPFHLWSYQTDLALTNNSMRWEIRLAWQPKCYWWEIAVQGATTRHSYLSLGWSDPCPTIPAGFLTDFLKRVYLDSPSCNFSAKHIFSPGPEIPFKILAQSRIYCVWSLRQQSRKPVQCILSKYVQKKPD